MKLWLIKRNRGSYDENHGHVIAADAEDQVRALAAEASCVEPKTEWLVKQNSPCSIIGEAVEGLVGIVLTDFHAG